MAAVAALGAAGQYLQLDFSPFFFQKKNISNSCFYTGPAVGAIGGLVPGAGFGAGRQVFFFIFFIFV